MKPTRVRYLIVVAAAMAAVVLYLDRACLSFVEQPVSLDLGIGTDEFSWALSAFFFAYALFQVPAGFLSDRYGARRMLTLYLLACVVCTIGTAIAFSFFFLLMTRLALGIAEAGAYPTCAGLLRRWVPVRSRGVASSCVALGGRLGGATTPIVTALLLVALLPAGTPSTLLPEQLVNAEKLGKLLESPPEGNVLAARLQSIGTVATVESLNTAVADPKLTDGLNLVGLTLPREARTLLAKADRTPAETQRLNRLAIEAALPGTVRPLYAASWRSVFFVYAGFGLLIAITFWVVVRDRAGLHPWANEAEAALVPPAPPPGSTGLPRDLPRLLVSSRNLWLSSGAQFCLNVGWAFLLTRLPTYLEKVHQSPIEVRGLQSAVPLYAGAFGMLMGGFLTDWLTRRYGVFLGRKLPIGVMPLVGAAAFFLVPVLGTAWAVVIALAVVGIATDMANPATWSLMQDMTGKHVGAAMGWANMWGNFGAALSPLLLSRVQANMGWDAMFTVCGSAFVLAGLLGLMIDARKPLDRSAP